MTERMMIQLGNGESHHVIDNTDDRSLSESRFRGVYPEATDGEVKDFMDVFYRLKDGNLILPG